MQGLLVSDVPADDSAAVSPEVASAAETSGENPTDLQGAVNTLRIPVDEYLAAEAERNSPHPPDDVAKPQSATPPVTSVSGVWDRLAYCESRGNWHTNTGNGYYGGLQEDMTFWRNHGGLAYASRPDLASPAAQVAVAQRGLSSQGWGAWPACSRALGLR